MLVGKDEIVQFSWYFSLGRLRYLMYSENVLLGERTSLNSIFLPIPRFCNKGQISN